MPLTVKFVVTLFRQAASPTVPTLVSDDPLLPAARVNEVADPQEVPVQVPTNFAASLLLLLVLVLVQEVTSIMLAKIKWW